MPISNGTGKVLLGKLNTAPASTLPKNGSPQYIQSYNPASQAPNKVGRIPDRIAPVENSSPKNPPGQGPTSNPDGSRFGTPGHHRHGLNNQGTQSYRGHDRYGLSRGYNKYDSGYAPARVRPTIFNGKPLPAGGACGAAYRPLWALLFGALALLAIAGLIAGLVIGLKDDGEDDPYDTGLEAIWEENGRYQPCIPRPDATVSPPVTTTTLIPTTTTIPVIMTTKVETTTLCIPITTTAEQTTTPATTTVEELTTAAETTTAIPPETTTVSLTTGAETSLMETETTGTYATDTTGTYATDTSATYATETVATTPDVTSTVETTAGETTVETTVHTTLATSTIEATTTEQLTTTVKTTAVTTMENTGTTICFIITTEEVTTEIPVTTIPTTTPTPTTTPIPTTLPYCDTTTIVYNMVTVRPLATAAGSGTNKLKCQGICLYIVCLLWCFVRVEFWY